MKRTGLCCALAAGLQLAGVPAQAVELSWSGFGTLGYAQTNRPYTYQRFLRDEGSFERDTLLGGQVDAQFTPQWSATAQVTLAPSLRHDKGWSITPTWAFVGWRPSDDWLVRVGRLRLPLYLHSESLDVGQSHDMVRLPTEMYSIVPSNDFNGVALTKTWPHGESGEVSLDAYTGRSRTSARLWNRDGLPPVIAAGGTFTEVLVRVSGLVLTLRDSDLQLRAGVHRASTRRSDDQALPVTFPYVATPIPGVGYYQVNDAIPGPGVPTVNPLRNTIATLGAEAGFGDGWALSAEFARDFQHGSEVGSDTRGGYLALQRRVGHFTPYTSVAALRSSRVSLNWYDQLTTPLSPYLPGADQLAAAQRMAAEGIYAADQRSWAIGSAYRLSATSKLKFEWMRTRIGRVSRLVDTPAGSDTVRNTSVDVLSINYNFVF